MHQPAGDARTARLFRNGRSQAVRIPKEWEFEGDEVEISRDDHGRLIMETKQEPKKFETLADMLNWLKANGPIQDFPGDPGDDDLLPLDEPEL